MLWITALKGCQCSWLSWNFNTVHACLAFHRNQHSVVSAHAVRIWGNLNDKNFIKLVHKMPDMSRLCISSQRARSGSGLIGRGPELKSGGLAHHSFMFPISSCPVHWQDSAFPNYKDSLQLLPHMGTQSVTVCVCVCVSVRWSEDLRLKMLQFGTLYW